MHAPHPHERRVAQVAQLSDQELVAALQRLLQHERRVTARLLLHLGEVDARGLYRQYAYGSLFDYCVQALHLSEAEAFLRIRAARLGRQFPRVLDMLERGELHLSAIKLLSPVLDRENQEELLTEARHKSKREVERLLLNRAPKPEVPATVRKLPQRARTTAAPSAVPEPAALSLLALGARTDAPSPRPVPQRQTAPEPQPNSAPEPRHALDPLGAGRYKLQLTLDDRLHGKLQQAQRLMGFEHSGDLARVLERALDLLIAERMKQRFGVCDKPRASHPERRSPGSRHIPHAVRREVLVRDGGQCTFVSSEGRRCQQRSQLELHHDQPFARAGEPTVTNIRLLCRAHNALLAERDYGRAFLRRRIEQARAARGARALVPEPHRT